ncbi:MAG: hypothetical protein EZS28_021283, partial [Streblomastix strix]
ANLIDEKEKFRKEKKAIEQKHQQQIIILEGKLQEEKESREIAEEKTQKAEEQVRKERKEKMELKIDLKNKEEEIIKCLERQKELESKLIDENKKKMTIEKQLEYETEEKQESIEKCEETEKRIKVEVERRRKAESEIQRINWENEQQKNEYESMKQEYECEVENRRDYEIKYHGEVEEKEKEKKLVQEKEIERQEALKQLLKEKEEKEKSIKQSQSFKQTIGELTEKLLNTQNESKIKSEELESEKEKIIKGQQQLKEFERKRKEADQEKQRIEEENMRLRIENDRNKYLVAKINEKYGSEKVEKEIQLIGNLDKEKDERILQLEESNKRKDEEIRRKDEEMRRKDEIIQKFEQEKEKLEKEKEKEKQEKEKEKQEKEKREAELKKLNQQPNIAITNPDPTDIEFSDGDGVMKRISKKQNNWNTISLTQILDNGVQSLEAEFNTTSGEGRGAIGIVRDSYNIPAGAHWNSSPHNEHIAVFAGKYWGGDFIYYKGSGTPGITGFKNNQIVRLEYNSEKGTVTYFLGNVQQLTYISGIREKVRFVIGLYVADSKCTIRSLKKLTQPTAVIMIGEKTVQW